VAVSQCPLCSRSSTNSQLLYMRVLLVNLSGDLRHLHQAPHFSNSESAFASLSPPSIHLPLLSFSLHLFSNSRSWSELSRKENCVHVRNVCTNKIGPKHLFTPKFLLCVISAYKPRFTLRKWKFMKKAFYWKVKNNNNA
jgi:hypothetical protein